MPDKIYLKQMQALPLIAKVRKTQLRIREWYEHYDGNVCVSFSGGKDSTVLAHLVHELYPEVPLVFANTGLEYPEIQAFARKMCAEFVRPSMRFDQVISTYGYPIISKEVADAIYYARRIKKIGNKGVNAIDSSRDAIPYGEKTTEYYQRMLTGQPSVSKDGDLYINSSGWESKVSGKRNQFVGNMQGVKDETGHFKSTLGKRQELSGDRETESNGDVVSSIYNKEKWLPLCNEARFMISGKCCSKMKKGPMQIYQRKTKRVPYIGTLAEESKLREQAWIKHGCNAFDSKKPSSQPMSFWTEQDVLRYLYTEGWEIASVYGDIVGVDDDGMEYEPLPGVDCKLKCTKCQRTGCIFCGFGAHLDKGNESRFQRLARTHPKQYEYCMEGGAMG